MPEPGHRRVLMVGGGAVIAAVLVATAVVVFGHGSRSGIRPVAHADRSYLSAVHSDLPKETAPDSKLLAFGHVVCNTFAVHESPAERVSTLNRPDLVRNANSRSELFGEALNHLCPQYQLAGIKPVPAPPGAPRPHAPSPSTTSPGPSVSVIGP
jgi:hypothetical protein